MTAATMKNLADISEEEMKMQDAPPHLLLNPDAPAFHPLYEPVNLAIYNDGVPAMSFQTEKDRHGALRDIQDEAIDEGFPPDAADAGELDAADAFVETMAMLAMLEEQEERARIEFNHIKKRWEVRRAEGLHGRPKPPKHVVDPAPHDRNRNRPGQFSQVSSIVPHSHFAVGKEAAKVRQQQHESATRRDIKAGNRNVNANPAVPRNYIQQPRKGPF